MDTKEQKARDMLERMGVDDAQTISAGSVVELANLIAEAEQLREMQASYEEWLRSGEHLVGLMSNSISWTAFNFGAWWADRPWRKYDA
jgi:hypothetical protein